MKTKRIAYALLLSSLLVGCTPSDAELQEQGWVKDPANNGWVQNPADNGWVQNPANNGWVKDPATNGWVNNPAENGWVKDPATNGWVKDPANNGWVDADELTPSPTVEAEVVHWVPGADTANVTFKLDLEGATKLNVVLGGKLLKEFVDYEFDAGKLTILGAFLEDSGLGLGEHKGYVFTENGSVEIKVHIVSNPAVEGTTIPLKEIQDVNLSGFGAQTLSAPISNAGDLLITEISTDMGVYNYIEVFNNTTSEYNLKDHRVVFADPSKQKKNYANGLLDLPLGSAGVAYIYQDYKIPALSSALIWIVNTSPWEVASNKLSEAANVQSLLLGNGEENLNVAKFKSVYGLDENVLVFPSRTSYMLGRSDAWAGKEENGYWGTALSKGASNRWSDINSKVDNRMIQIQKVDETTVFQDETGYYVYEMDVLNREEDIYANGTLDANDVLTNSSSAIASTNRQFMHGLFGRRAYVNSATDKTHTGKYVGMDLYNGNDGTEGCYYKMLEEAVTPLATAMIYPNIIDDPENPGTKIAAKWGESYEQFALQYSVPAQGSHMARFIPLEGTTALYTAKYAEHTYKALYEAGLGSEVAGYGANATVKVPVDPAYPTDYLAANHNSAGRVTSLMLPAATA